MVLWSLVLKDRNLEQANLYYVFDWLVAIWNQRGDNSTAR